jgi:hypothetical protein
MKRLDDHTGFVYTATMMKNITLSADETLIEQARKRAVVEHTTLNSLFRAWLARYASQPAAADQYEQLMARLGYVQPGRKFSHEDMNERR